MIIDVHVHLNWNGMTTDKIVEHMDSIGVDKAWALTWEAIDGARYIRYTRLSTEEALDGFRRYPDRFIPFCGVDPRFEDAPERVRRWVERGCRGYGEHKVRLCIDNPDSIEVYRTCGELGIPVLFHMDVPLPGSREWYNADIDGLERAMRKCPDTIFIGHGPGWWREISGDADSSPEAYPKGKVKPGGKLVRLLREYPNLYADISAGSGLNALRRDPEFTMKFVEENYDKLLYGTDSYDTAHLDFLRSLNLREEVFRAITYENAVKIIPV